MGTLQTPVSTATSPFKAEVELYPFYRANIHERRWVARFCRALPLFFLLSFLAIIIVGVSTYHPMLLFVCAVLNTALWLWISCTGIFAILGICTTRDTLDELAKADAAATKKGFKCEADIEIADCKAMGKVQEPKGQASGGYAEDPWLKMNGEADAAAGGRSRSPVGRARPQVDGAVVHMVVFPNYKEDENMMEETIRSLAEAQGSSTFRLVLAMEARESGADSKGSRLQELLGSHFAHVTVALHPANLMETHLDESVDNEVAGKASNLKYGVEEGYKACKNSGVDIANVVVTVADADCIFHPNYFRHVTNDFEEMREATGTDQLWTMWQAPQLPFRNYWDSFAPSRVWGYLASMYEFSGVTSLSMGGHHMVFSGYSLPLALAVGAQPWDGDVMAEDHHAFLKCYYYSVWCMANAIANGHTNTNSLVRVKPVFLPVKSTSVVSDEGWWKSWVERWSQAKRHAYGVAELSYALLASFDAVLTLPFSAYSPGLIYRMLQLNIRLFCVHILPIVQSCALAVLTVYWYWNNRSVPMCPDRLWVADLHDSSFLLCGLAGAWVLVWPVVVPMLFLSVAAFLFIWVSFVLPAQGNIKSIWHSQDSAIPPTFGSVRLTLFLQISVDMLIYNAPLMVFFGFIPEILAYWTVCLYGNNVTYVTAAKGSGALKQNASAAGSYGSTRPDEAPAAGLLSGAYPQGAMTA